ncbi:hypothetical protein DNTS_022694 [Danionella cerebrum]|uniref:VPS9 domain-containing protein n=1 Tax=Danionella cerebrum TaxID=2873325 RepID=A0A553MXX5_9TELE|nr:hypothetical protein DNTS_022694 [Danionella translucida]
MGDRLEPVKEFPLITTGTALRLAESHLSFPDLFQLLHFYSLSRELAVPVLRSSDIQHDSWNIRRCRFAHVHDTAAPGAMCFINPLYVQEHGDDWLTRSPTSKEKHSIRQDKRLSSTRAWEGRGLKLRSAAEADNLHRLDQDRGSSEKSLVIPTAPGGIMLRRQSTPLNEDPQKGEPIQSPLPQSPHRVSWIEDPMWLSLPSTQLLPPCLELDSLSVSSVEEESESAPSPQPSASHPSPRLHLADKMKNRLSAVGQAIGGLVLPQRRLNKRVQEMAERKAGIIGEAVGELLEKICASEGSCSEMLQDVRSSLTSLRELLLDCPEIQSITDGFGDMPDFELDAMLELALHKVALKPVYAPLCNRLLTARQEDGTVQHLTANKNILEERSLEELEGAAGAGVPDLNMMEKIQQRWRTMHNAYSPNKKVDLLLKVCKNIYHSMNANAKPGTIFGADDFLPCLTWVVLRSDVSSLQVDTDYMMELLDPVLLQGEGGYYLTSLYAALFYISSFRPRLARRQLSSEAKHSLSQWHRRRTMHCTQSRRSRNRRTIRRHRPSDGNLTLKEVTESETLNTQHSHEEFNEERSKDQERETLPET